MLNLRKIIVSSSLGALRLVFALLGGAVPGLLGIPGASGVINVLWAGGFLALPPLITRSFGTATIAGTVYSLLALPLPLSGPAGFFPKVLIGITTGLAADLVFVLLRSREKSATILAGTISQTVLGLEFAFLGLAFGVPGIEKYLDLQFSLVGMTGTVLGGAFSGLLAWLVYRKIRGTDIVRRIRG